LEQTHRNGDDCADRDDGNQPQERADAVALASAAAGCATSRHSRWQHLPPYADGLMLPHGRLPVTVYVRAAR
jgi:hypothetical protein